MDDPQYFEDQAEIYLRKYNPRDLERMVYSIARVQKLIEEYRNNSWIISNDVLIDNIENIIKNYEIKLW